MMSGTDVADSNRNLAIEFAVTQSIVGIIGKDHDGVIGRQIGTGTLLKAGNTRLILTAHHVVAGCAPDELRFFTPPQTVARTELGTPIPFRFDKFMVNRRLPIGQIESDEANDLAALVVDPTFEGESWWSWRTLAHKDPPPMGMNVMILGHPSELAKPFDQFGNRMVLKVVEWPTIAESETFRSSAFDPELHFLTTFPSAQKYHPGGFSGAGVWANYEMEGPVWHSEPAYLGMAVEYYERAAKLKAIRADVIQRFLKICRVAEHP